MKKKLSAVLTLLFMLLLAACSPKTEKEVGARFFVNHHSDYVESGGVIYFLEEVRDASADEGVTRLSYRFAALDIESGECMPLCFRPECTHEGNDCGAFVSGDGVRLSLYDGRLYWIEGGPRSPALYSMNTDGSDRKKVTAIDAELYKLAYGMGTAEIMDGVLYVCGIAEGVKNAETVRSAVVFRQPLDSEKAELIFSSEERVRVFGRIMDGRLYFAAAEEWPEEYDEEEGYAPLRTVLYSFDPESAELKELYSRTDPVTDYDQMIAVDGRLYLFGYARLAIYDVTDGSVKVMDDARASTYPGDGAFMCWDSAHDYSFLDADGNELIKGSFPPEGDPELPDGFYGRSFIGAIGKKMYYRMDFFSSNGRETRYMDLFSSDGRETRYIVEFDAETGGTRLLYASNDDRS